MPVNADMEHISAHLEDGVLKIKVPRLAEGKMKQAKVIGISGSGSTGEDIKATKTELWGDSNIHAAQLQSSDALLHVGKE